MVTHRIARTALLAMLIACVALANAATSDPTAPRKTLRAFANEEEIAALFRKWADERQRRIAEGQLMRGVPIPGATPSPPFAQFSAPQPMAKAARAEPSAESITNVQHAGVDEGGIVKVHGDHLVILRRGRLFTISIRERQLKGVATLDAFGKGIDGRGAWYDELLVSGNTVVVIGYSYRRGGTEIGLFEITPAGELRYKSTYHLRSNDYYSSRNYASRLIGTKLIFYTPLRLNAWGANPFGQFPALRRWRPDATPEDFKRIAPASRIYRTDEELDPFEGVALHTVAICDVAKPELECTSTAVLGPAGRVFYVSPTSVFVWTTTWSRATGSRQPHSAVFRIPLDGSAPSALKTAGSPIDQFSFLESGDGYLNVLLRPNGGGDGMWGAERSAGQLGLMRVALSSFSDGRDSAPRSAYRVLPTPAAGALQSRYIGPYLLYGAGAGWRKPQETRESSAYAVRYASDTPAQVLSLVHGVDRIEALGDDAVIVGSDGNDLHFSSVRLGTKAEVVARYTRANAAQGETRSHGFYYRADTAENGLAGLPIIANGGGASRQLRQPSASLLFLRNVSLNLTELGTLESKGATSDDACVASCVDWYGNSRPIFLRNRIFALMGYEIVEGRLAESGVVETGRLNFEPHWVNQLQ
jgi:hypothetical protein